MSFLYSLIILPIETLIEFIFCAVLIKFDALGVAGAIVAVSLAVNFLALPIYNVADDIMLKERNLQNKMAHWIKHIKSTFKGDEKFMMLTEYYRQNNYNPLYSFRSSLSVLIQVPFFLAAYNFLSSCSALNNQSILFIKDLSLPDGLLCVGGFSINVLPIVMTLINVVSAIIYTSDAPLKEKIQTFLLPAVFLVLLYNSPSGLVCYWILNNLFSLVKNIVKKCKNPGKILYVVLSIILIFISAYFFIYHGGKTKSLLIYTITLLFIALPFVKKFVGNKINFASELKSSNFSCFLCSAFSLALLAGFLLPSNVIATSPVEFSYIGNVKSPMEFVYSAIGFFMGLFVVWPFILYKMFGDKTKKILAAGFFILSVCAITNAYIFNYDYRTIDIFFKVENRDVFENYRIYFSLLPLLVLAVVSVVTYFAFKFNKIKYLTLVVLVLCLSEFALGMFNSNKINKGFEEYTQKLAQQEDDKNVIRPKFNLSKTQKNVMVVLLDRGISDYFPYILEQLPELKDKFDGFTYYPNTLSFGESTISGSPALLGGYEYTPQEMNKRNNEKLVDKHNEALKVMPKIFSDAGYDVYYSDPPWMNYQGFFDKGDLFDDIKNANVFPVQSKYGSNYIAEHKEDFTLLSPTDIGCSSSLKHFSIVQILYPPLRGIVYHGGEYYISPEKRGADIGLDYYAGLYYLPQLTEFNNQNATWSFIYNETAHEGQKLILPNYTPGTYTDESQIAPDGGYCNEATGDLRDSYHGNLASLILLSKYFDCLKENNCYDNTRIIIVADHGRGYNFRRFSNFEKIKKSVPGEFNPLLLVKDFNEKGIYKIDNNFYTNADTVNFAVKNLNVSNVNPFTNKKFKNADDFDYFDIYSVFDAGKRNAFDYQNKNEFPLKDSRGYRVKDNIFEDINWTKLSDLEEKSDL